MLPAPNLDQLVANLRARLGPDATSGRGPYVLFLGEGCARAAGAPSRVDLARDALVTFKYEPPEAWAGKSGEEVVEQFSKHTSSLSSSQYGRMLRHLYAKVAVPSFYQDLALMIRERFFPLVVTMNFDTLLEQALGAAGVRSEQYLVTTFGRERTSSGTESMAPLTHLIKLHGDLSQDIAHLDPQEIENALSPSRNWIKAEFAGDIIMVAHEPGSDQLVDRWLAHMPQRELWWVNENPPDSRAASWSSQPPHEIVGDVGRPNLFFSQLALRLLQEPADLESAGRGLESRRLVEDPDDSGLMQTLQVEIRRNQAVLYNLDQERSPSQENPQLQAQIQYQKRRMSRLEDRLRGLPEVQNSVLEAVKTVAERIRSASLPARSDAADDAVPYTLESVADFVDLQADAVAKELASAKPNQLVISASLSATLSVADRLRTEYGDGVIKLDDIKQLASLAPTAAGKVVL